MTDRTPAAQTSEPRTADWDEFACDGEKCGCHDPFICSTCGCTHNEAEAAAPPAASAGLDAERLNRAAYRTPKRPDESMKEWLYRVAAAYAEGEPTE